MSPRLSLCLNYHLYVAYKSLFAAHGMPALINLNVVELSVVMLNGVAPSQLDVFNDFCHFAVGVSLTTVQVRWQDEAPQQSSKLCFSVGSKHSGHYDGQDNDTKHHVKVAALSIVSIFLQNIMFSTIVLNVIMLNVVVLSATWLNITMLCVIGEPRHSA